MPVGICKKCDVYYEFEDETEAKEFPDCECGNKLVYFDSLEDYYNNLNKSNEKNVKKSVIKGSTYTEKKVAEYENDRELGDVLKISGIIIAVLGFILSAFFATSGYMLIFALGFIIFVCGNSLVSRSSKGWSWAKGLEGENLVLRYLKTLPKDYFIFNDVKFQGSRGNIDHIVIGPNGMFVVETKNYSGKWRIDGDQWYYYKQGKYNQARYDPTDQVTRNEYDLENFLWSNNISSLDLSLTSIVALVNDNFRVTRKTHEYDVMAPKNLKNFILSYNGNPDVDALKKSVLILKQCCTEFIH